MGLREQSAAATLAKLGIQIPGLPAQPGGPQTPGQGPTLSQSVMESSPSLAFGATPDERTGYVGAMRAADQVARQPGLDEHAAIMQRDQEAQRAGFPGGYRQEQGYGRDQVNRDRQVKLDIAQEQTQAEQARLAANQEFTRNENDKNRKAAADQAQAQRDAANQRDTQGVPGDSMYKTYAAAKANEASYMPGAIINRFRGRRDPAVLDTLKPILDRKGQLQHLTGMASILKGLPGGTLAERATAMLRNDPEATPEDFANPLAGLDEYQLDFLLRTLELEQ